MDYGFLLLNAITNSLLHFLVKFPRQGIHRLWSATFHASQSQTVYYTFSFEVSPNTSFSEGNHTYPRGEGGRGSSIVKVPADVPPARIYFFGLLV